MFDILRGALPPAKTDAEIAAQVALAAAKCQSAILLMQQRNITEVEGQSIYIYTSNFVYKEFTAAFRSLQTCEIQRWSNYAFTLRSALGKLETPQPTHPKPPDIPEFFVV